MRNYSGLIVEEQAMRLTLRHGASRKIKPRLGGHSFAADKVSGCAEQHRERKEQNLQQPAGHGRFNIIW
nr:hypothetical protein Ade03nite_86170 [Actinoplanes derwentensis]